MGSETACAIEELEETAQTGHSQLAALQKRVNSTRAELIEAQRLANEARREAVVLGARVSVLPESDKHEVDELRLRLPVLPSAKSGPDVAMLQLRCHTEQLRAREGRTLLGAERALHREEVELLQRELRAARAALGAGSMRSRKSPSPVSGRSSLGVATRQTESDNANSTAAGKGLRKLCEDLHEPANLLFAVLKQPLLPPTPSSGTVGAPQLEDWLAIFAGRLDGVCEQIANRGVPTAAGH